MILQYKMNPANIGMSRNELSQFAAEYFGDNSDDLVDAMMKVQTAVNNATFNPPREGQNPAFGQSIMRMVSSIIISSFTPPIVTPREEAVPTQTLTPESLRAFMDQARPGVSSTMNFSSPLQTFMEAHPEPLSSRDEENSFRNSMSSIMNLSIPFFNVGDCELMNDIMRLQEISRQEEASEEPPVDNTRSD